MIGQDWSILIGMSAHSYQDVDGMNRRESYEVISADEPRISRGNVGGSVPLRSLGRYPPLVITLHSVTTNSCAYPL